MSVIDGAIIVVLRGGFKMTREEMKKKIYQIVLSELQNQFGCGDTVEVGDREVCAEAVANALIKARRGQT